MGHNQAEKKSIMLIKIDGITWKLVNKLFGNEWAVAEYFMICVLDAVNAVNKSFMDKWWAIAWCRFDSNLSTWWK